MSIRWLLTAGLLLLVSCGGGEENRCSFECSGCCTAEGECKPGTMKDMCGFGGQACSACAGNQQCGPTAGGGMCEPCSAFNCAGCCTTEGECLAGTDNSACGKSGDTCVACPSPSLCQSTGVGGGICQ